MAWPSLEQLPPTPVDSRFVFQPLGPEHNERDHRAWMSSVDHIRATPGFRPGLDGSDDWPVPMSLEQNLDDLRRHAAEFAAGEAYTYSVVDPTTTDVVGCVYVSPDRDADAGAAEQAPRAVVRSWVRADRAGLDAAVASAIAMWLAETDLFTAVRWPGRPELSR
jgi:hypothetical protein